MSDSGRWSALVIAVVMSSAADLHAQSRTVTPTSVNPVLTQYNMTTTLSGTNYTIVVDPLGPPNTIQFNASVTTSSVPAVVDGPIGGTAFTFTLGSGHTLTSGNRGIGLFNASTVINEGTINATTVGVFAQGGGKVRNATTGSIHSSTTHAVQFTTVSGTVSNAGGISTVGAGAGVLLSAGGTVYNGSADEGGSTSTGASITGTTNGVQITGAGAVTNYLNNTITGQGTSNAGILLSSGTVTNGGGVTGVANGVRFEGAGSGSLTNSGSIHGTSTITNFGNGVLFNLGGVGTATLVNEASGTITGDGNNGVFLTNTSPTPASSITNQGVIGGSKGSITGKTNGIQLSGSGAMTVDNQGSIVGTNLNGIVALGGTATVDNKVEASIQGATNGVQYGPGTTAGGLMTNAGQVIGLGASGVALQNGGTVINESTGVIESQAGAVASGDRNGVTVLNAVGTVENRGSILSVYSSGVLLNAGGSVTNEANSFIRSTGLTDGLDPLQGQSGVTIRGGTTGINQMTNAGEISGAFANGVQMANGGTLTNDGMSALIKGQKQGVIMTGSGEINNTLGSIIGVTGSGVQASGGVTVESSALIQGGVNAVRFDSGTNFLNLRSGSESIGIIQLGSGFDHATVYGGANIAGVSHFDGGSGVNRFTFDNYSGEVQRISGNASVDKKGSSITALVGTNTYQGTTTVESGTLLISGDSSGVAGTATVGDGAILGGREVYGGGVEVQQGGTLGPGGTYAGGLTDIETLSIGGNVTFEAQSHLLIQMSSLNLASDILLVGGDLNLGSMTALDLVDLATAERAIGDKLTLINYAGVWDGGVFDGLANGTIFQNGANLWKIAYDDAMGGTNFSSEQNYSGFVTLTIVPEPSVCLLGGLGALVMCRRKRRPVVPS